VHDERRDSGGPATGRDQVPSMECAAVQRHDGGESQGGAGVGGGGCKGPSLLVLKGTCSDVVGSVRVRARCRMVVMAMDGDLFLFEFVR
jgi:hypothetical protein